jgi:hypothetical protein
MLGMDWVAYFLSISLWSYFKIGFLWGILWIGFKFPAALIGAIASAVTSR